MITFSKLERKGHLGNQLFQIAATVGIATKNNQEFSFPKWTFADYFEVDFPITDQRKFNHVPQPNFHFDPIELDQSDHDLEGWFQSEDFFDRDATKALFQFKSSVLDDVRTRFGAAFSKKTILISIRRGDFVDHPDYFQLPISYYLNALFAHFPDWETRNLILFSDDIKYCKFHFSFLENVYFGDAFSAIEQLAAASMCDDFIISNSTFSWWSAWLGEKKTSKVIRPLHYFTAAKNKIDDEKDYFPKRWTVFDHQNKKINLGTAFLALKKHDEVIENYLNATFDFKNKNHVCDWIEAKKSDEDTTVVLINNVVLPPFALYYVVSKRIENPIVAVYLYGKYLSISRFWEYTTLKRQFDFGIFTRILSGNKKSTTELIAIGLANDFPISEILSEKQLLSVLGQPEKLVFHSYAGKVGGFTEFKYFAAVTKRKCTIAIKTFIKNCIRPKKQN